MSKLTGYATIYDDAEALTGVVIKAAALPSSLVMALVAVQDLGYATLIVYEPDAKEFNFRVVKVGP